MLVRNSGPHWPKLVRTNTHAWLLDDVHALESGIDSSGQLGFWRVRGSALRSVRNKLR